MYSGSGFWSRQLAARFLLALVVFAAGLTVGCGSDSGAGEEETNETTQSRQISEESRLTAKTAATLKYVERKFGDEKWYPSIAGIYVQAGSAATVRTTLYGPKNAARNQRIAEEICKAVISAPQVDNAGVFYDAARGGSTAQCP